EEVREVAEEADVRRYPADAEELEEEEREGDEHDPRARIRDQRSIDSSFFQGVLPGCGATIPRRDLLSCYQSDVQPFVAAPAEPDALRQRAREDGFVFLPRLLPVQRLGPLRALVDAALHKRRWVV